MLLFSLKNEELIQRHCLISSTTVSYILTRGPRPRITPPPPLSRWVDLPPWNIRIEWVLEKWKVRTFFFRSSLLELNVNYPPNVNFKMKFWIYPLLGGRASECMHSLKLKCPNLFEIIFSEWFFVVWKTYDLRNFIFICHGFQNGLKTNLWKWRA